MSAAKPKRKAKAKAEAKAMAAAMEPPKGDLPYVLLPYQQRWLEDQSKVKVWEKSRRIGASWCVASEGVLEAAAKDGQDVWYLAYSEDAALEFIRDCARWTTKFGLALITAGAEEVLVEDEDESILAYQIRFASGLRVTALTSRPRNLRGKQGYVIIDEAAFHDDLPGLLKAAMALLMWGGRVAIISTHFGVSNTFNKLCDDVRSGRLPYSLHRTTLDDALADGLYRRICMLSGVTWSQPLEDAWRKELVDFYGDDADEELFCVPSKSGGAYLSNELIESRMVPAPVVRLDLPDTFLILEGGNARAKKKRTEEFHLWLIAEVEPLLRRLRKDRQHFFGFDFGRLSDMSCFAPIELTPQLVREVSFLVEMRNVPHDQQREFLDFVVPRLPNFGGGKIDATGNGESLGEHGATTYGPQMIEAVKITDAFYAEHMPHVKAGLQDGTLLLPRDLLVRQDFAAFQVVNGTPKLPKAKTSSKRVDGKTQTRHGDSGIAVLLGYTASRFGVGGGQYYAVERRGRTVDLGNFDDDSPGLGEPRERSRGIF